METIPVAKKRILCLEDNEDTCELTTVLLEPKGYEVITAKTIAEALNLIQENKYSLLITDMRFADESGNDFIRKVKAMGLGMPILVHSAAAFKQDIDEALNAGANDYLVKPNGWTKLIETVEKLTYQRFSAH